MSNSEGTSRCSSPSLGGEAAPLLDTKNVTYSSLDTNTTDTVSISPTCTVAPVFTQTPDEILFQIKYAHLHKGTDWIDSIENTSGPEETKWSLQLRIRDALNEYPLSMSQKMLLRRYLNQQDVLKAVKTKQKNKKEHKQSRPIKYQVDTGLWEKNIKRIEGFFGSNVASYFLFLRFLFYLNAFIAIVMFGFVSIPQILPGDTAIPSNITGYFGVLSTSVLFYGAYSNDFWGYYERPFAYLLTWICVNIISFIVIVTSMYVGYRRNKIQDQGDEFRFAWRLMTSWDFSVYSRSGVMERKSAIKTDIKEMIREEQYQERNVGYYQFSTYIVRCFVNILVLVILGGSGYVIYIVADTTLTPVEVPDFLQDFISKYELPLVVSGLKVIVPPILIILCKLEKWHPRTEIKLNIVRTALFYLASLVVFVTSLYDVSSECVGVNGTSVMREVSEFCCWENEVGEEIFKVLVLDLGIMILVGILFDATTALFVQCGVFHRTAYRDFDVTSNVLDLIYGQSLLWLGLYFSPFLALIQVVKLVVTFYFRYFIARHCNMPPAEMFKASRSGTFYLFVLMVYLFVSLFPMTYAVIVLVPSYDCGPFRRELHVYEVITSRIGNLPTWLQDILYYVSTTTVIAPLLILLLLCVLYYRAKAGLYQNLIEELRNQLRFERRVEKRKVFRKAKLSQGISSVSGMDRIGRAKSITQ